MYQATEDSKAFAEELDRREKRFAAELAGREAILTAEHAEAAAAAAAQTSALADEIERSERRVASLASALEQAGVEAEAAAVKAAEEAAADTARLLEEQSALHAAAAAEVLVKERVQRAEALDEVRMRLGAVKEVLDVNANNLKRSHAANRLSLAVFSLASAAAAGAPLADEVAQVRAAVGIAEGNKEEDHETDALVAAVLGTIPLTSKAAKAGVPTAAELADRLVDVNRAARSLVLVPGGGGGLFAHAAAYAASWFRVGERWTGGGSGGGGGGGGVEAALAAAAVEMAEGRLAGAADVLESGLEGTAAAAAVAGWVADARERQRLELALTVLRSHASAVASSLA